MQADPEVLWWCCPIRLPPEFPTLALGLDMIKARADPKGTYACLVAVARGEGAHLYRLVLTLLLC